MGGKSDIYILRVGGKNPTNLTAGLEGDHGEPAFSPDGRFIAFRSERGGTMNLWRVGIDEESGKVREDPEPVTVPASWAGPFQATPDGSRIVFTSVERERTLERVSFDPATEKVSAASVPLARFGAQIGLPHVSLQGDLLTFPEFGSKTDILVLKTDGTGVRSLTDDGYRNWHSTFSPAATRLMARLKRARASGATRHPRRRVPWRRTRQSQR